MRAIAVSAFGAEPCPVEVPKPDPGVGEVRVKVEYAALNPLDRQICDRAPDGAGSSAYPLILGADFAGRVDMIGPGENPFRVGDPVFGRVTVTPPGRCGAYSEYVCVPQNSPITHVPRDLPLQLAAALPTAGGTAAQILGGTAVRSGLSLLVVGAAGGVGSFLTQLAAARGITVVAAVRGDEGRRMKALGATATIDTSLADGTLDAAVKELYPGGVDALVDLVSTRPAAFAAHAALVREGGVAVTTRGAAAPAGVAWVDFRFAPTAGLLDELAAAAACGELSVPVDMELPLEKAPQALVQNRAGGARGKTVFTI
ncbi:NADP-dependent oxidoreductase [Streptomyces sp. B1I3]|uniref:NADP-dependent oxidoreductase n=1 Tax=Streptomyces sp. B1I3 TaxID=3042264 RepID=UPI002784CC7E|nr:NADP-dependent oxidoreductase [Streptomyces sp. B1I3]MDQ0795344.1 NADPH2:quinone reductase [Streptomyces sp. B1I3]